ncbi:hypothetical protein F511_26421 [Dorcoceras hygrometricum]|uniref:Uncharacterized protein n=1 Tax=Dorcoceras hygrometricum TaxID=472368 RepID=A0A2Z7CAW9_9LAMI|nr:hypothetical protein F511_26421 [Dorcoceras hygrometricum]
MKIIETLNTVRTPNCLPFPYCKTLSPLPTISYHSPQAVKYSQDNSEDTQMEGVSTNPIHGGRSYWRRKGYMRLDSHSRRRRKMRMRVLKLDSGASDVSSSCWRFWRIKLTPPVELKLRFSPKKFILRMRDAYVDMMMRIASTRVTGNGFGRLPIKEYDEGMIVEIYRSIVAAQGKLAPPRAGVDRRG